MPSTVYWFVGLPVIKFYLIATLRSERIVTKKTSEENLTEKLNLLLSETEESWKKKQKKKHKNKLTKKEIKERIRQVIKVWN